MPNRYTVRDPATGRIVEFDWLDDTPPTLADLNEVVRQARAGASASAPTPQPKTYLDDNGNPISGPVYLDEQGNQIPASTYTATDPKTGRAVTFEWNAPQPPTDADMEEVFAAATPTGPARHPHARVADAVFSKQFADNVVNSGVDAVKNLANLGQTAFRAVTSLGFDPATGQPDPTMAALGKAGPSGILQGLKDRYGSAKAIRNTMFTDPVGAALDAAGAASGGASVARGAGNLLNTAARGGMRLGLKIPTAELAAKPKVALEIDAALEHGTSIPRLRSIADAGQARKQNILTSGAQHVSTQTPRLDAAIADARRLDASGRASYAAATKVKDEFVTGSETSIPNMVTQTTQVPTGILNAQGQPILNTVTRQVQQGTRVRPEIEPLLAEHLAQQAYRQINDHYQIPFAAPSPRVDALKPLAGDLKASIEAVYPEVGPINQELGPIYALSRRLVKSKEVPGQQATFWPTPRGVVHDILRTAIPSIERTGSRGLYFAGRGLETGANAVPRMMRATAPIPGMSALEQAIMRVNRHEDRP